MKKTLLIALAVAVVLVAIWFGTVSLQAPPQYPFVQGDIEAHFDDHVPDYAISKAGLIEDVDALVAHTQDLHADPYRIASQAAFLAKAEEIKAQIDALEGDDISAHAAFYHLQELAVFLEDGHTTLYPLNWEMSVESIFPLIMTPVEGSIFVKDVVGDQPVPERAEILAVNGLSIEQVMDETMQYVPGTLPQLKQSRFAEFLSMFIQTYYDMPSPWEVTYRHDGVVATATVEGVSQDAYFEATIPQRDYVESEVVVNGTPIPVLEFVGFQYGEWEKFQGFIQDFFARHQDDPYLVIDVRHHYGGNGDWGYYVLSHLTAEPLQGYEEFSFIVSPANQQIIRYGFEDAYYEMGIPRFLWGLPLYKLVEQDDPMYWIGRGILESEPGTFYHARWEDTSSYWAGDTADRFQGQVFLITSGETFSAGGVFAALFEHNDLGTIVGRETGGRVYLMSDYVPVVLPNSRLTYLVPTAKFIVSDENPDRGVMPDIPVALTAEDYANDVDRDMERVVELIEADMAAAD